MLKLDRLDWVDGIAINTFGLHVGIRVTDSLILGMIKEILPFGWEFSTNLEVDYLYSVIVGSDKSHAQIQRKHAVYSDILLLEANRDVVPVVDAIKRDIHLFVGEMSQGRVFIHSGVVGWGEEAILLPGLTFTGKSTLVAELVRAGAIYYSDEYAVLDGNGLVYPFARPLSIRDDGCFSGRSVRIEEIGGVSGTRPLPVGIIIGTFYEAGSPCSLTRLSPGEAVLSLLSNSLSARRQPETVLPVLKRVAERAACFSGPRGDASEAAEQILTRFGRADP